MIDVVILRRLCLGQPQFLGARDPRRPAIDTEIFEEIPGAGAQSVQRDEEFSACSSRSPTNSDTSWPLATSIGANLQWGWILS